MMTKKVVRFFLLALAETTLTTPTLFNIRNATAGDLWKFTDHGPKEPVFLPVRDSNGEAHTERQQVFHASQNSVDKIVQIMNRLANPMMGQSLDITHEAVQAIGDENIADIIRDFEEHGNPAGTENNPNESGKRITVSLFGKNCLDSVIGLSPFYKTGNWGVWLTITTNGNKRRITSILVIEKTIYP